MATTFWMSLDEVDRLSDDRFIDLAGRALYLQQRRYERLETVIANGVARAHGGRRRKK